MIGVHVQGAEREALERFAVRVLTEHQPGPDSTTCGSCHLFSPCPVEMAAIDANLIPPPPQYLVHGRPVWNVTATDTTITCETDWRRWGQGSIIVFDRQAIEEGVVPPLDVRTPATRDAWVAARAWVAAKDDADALR